MRLIFVSLIVTIGLSLTIPQPFQTAAVQGDAEIPDLLAYLAGTRLMVYDPLTGETEQILPGWEIRDFSLSPDNRLAIASPRSGSLQIYLLNYPYAENSPVPLLLSPSSDNEPISWSPDGQELLIESKEAGMGRLILWEDSRYRIIYIFQRGVGEFAWSLDGRLALTEYLYDSDSPNGADDEIYLWDGLATVSLSQNPTGYDRFPAWSSDGRLAFLSERNDGYGIFVWDGVSMQNGLPDIDTFENIASELTTYYSFPIWTNSNSITFSGYGQWDFGSQIYEWDGQSAKNISKNPFSDNGGQTWRADGYWAFGTLFSYKLIIRNESNRTLLKTTGQANPAWSRTGILAFCRPLSGSGWGLLIWFEGVLDDVSWGQYIEASWNNGEGVICTNG